MGSAAVVPGTEDTAAVVPGIEGLQEETDGKAHPRIRLSKWERVARDARGTNTLHAVVSSPPFTWYGEFADWADEALYREREVLDRFCTRVLVLYALDGALFTGSFIAALTMSDGVQCRSFAIISLAGVLVFAASALVTVGTLRRALPLAAAEAALLVALIYTPVVSAFFTTEDSRLVGAHFESASGSALPTLATPVWFPSDYASIHFILLSRFMLIGTFMPFRPLGFGLAIGCNYAAFLFCDVLFARSLIQHAVLLLLSLLVMSLLLVAVNGQLALIHRGRYYFYREQERAMDERDQLVRQETEAELKLEVAEKERQSRSRLIRMVRARAWAPFWGAVKSGCAKCATDPGGEDSS
jgi:hypothetical protein